MIDFLKTPAGKRFFDRDVPNLIKAINRVAQALEKPKELSLGDLLNSSNLTLPIARTICTSDPIQTTPVRTNLKHPPGMKPITLDESDITDAPLEARQRAMHLAIGHWIQTDPTERARLVEALRNDDEGMGGQRAATILALLVQFGDIITGDAK